MSNSSKAPEIIVRVIVIVLQVLAILGGGLLIGLNQFNYVLSNGVGGTIVGVASIVAIYEVLMICLVFLDGVNHQARLLVDIILNSLMAALTILGIIAVVVVAVLVVVIIPSSGSGGGTDYIVIFVAPIVFGIVVLVAFVVSAVVAGIIRSMMIRGERPVAIQLQPVVGAAPANVVIVQPPQAQGAGQAYYQPGYVVSVPPNAPCPYQGAIQPQSGKEAQPPAYSYDSSQTNKDALMGQLVVDDVRPVTSHMNV